MMVKELIQELQKLPEDLPVYYIDDGHYTEINKLDVKELSDSVYNTLVSTKFYKSKQVLDVLVGEPFTACVLDFKMFKKKDNNAES